MIRSVLWCASKGGHIRYTTSLAAAIAEADQPPGAPIDIGVLTTAPIGPLYESMPFPMDCIGQQIRERQDMPSTLHWLIDRIGRWPRLEYLLVKWLREHPDCRLIHLQEIHFILAPMTLTAIRRLDRRIVYTMHNIQPHRREQNRLLTALRRYWTRAMLLRVDAIVVHSETLRQELIDFYDIEPARVHVMIHGITPPHNEAGPTASLTPAPDTASGEKAVRLLCYGTLRRNKGFHHLLDALAEAPPNWEVVIAGFPNEPDYVASELEPRIARLRQAGRKIDFRLGYVDESDVAGLFANADVLALPYDGFNAQSGVLLDAMAHRKPVVVTESGALGETVRGLGIGVVTPSLAPAALREAFRAALAIPAEQLAQAWQRADVEYSWGASARTTIAIYRSLL